MPTLGVSDPQQPLLSQTTQAVPGFNPIQWIDPIRYGDSPLYAMQRQGESIRALNPNNSNNAERPAFDYGDLNRTGFFENHNAFGNQGVNTNFTGTEGVQYLTPEESAAQGLDPTQQYMRVHQTDPRDQGSGNRTQAMVVYQRTPDGRAVPVQASEGFEGADPSAMARQAGLMMLAGAATAGTAAYLAPAAGTAGAAGAAGAGGTTTASGLTAGATAGTAAGGSTLAGTVGQGALYGAGTGGLRAGLSGGNILQGALQGALTGAIGGGVGYGLTPYVQGATNALTPYVGDGAASIISNAGAGAVRGGVTSAARGGDFWAGAGSGALGSLGRVGGSSLINNLSGVEGDQGFEPYTPEQAGGSMDDYDNWDFQGSTPIIGGGEDWDALWNTGGTTSGSLYDQWGVPSGDDRLWYEGGDETGSLQDLWGVPSGTESSGSWMDLLGRAGSSASGWLGRLVDGDRSAMNQARLGLGALGLLSSLRQNNEQGRNVLTPAQLQTMVGTGSAPNSGWNTPERQTTANSFFNAPLSTYQQPSGAESLYRYGVDPFGGRAGNKERIAPPPGKVPGYAGGGKVGTASGLISKLREMFTNPELTQTGKALVKVDSPASKYMLLDKGEVFDPTKRKFIQDSASLANSSFWRSAIPRTALSQLAKYELSHPSAAPEDLLRRAAERYRSLLQDPNFQSFKLRADGTMIPHLAAETQLFKEFPDLAHFTKPEDINLSLGNMSRWRETARRPLTLPDYDSDVATPRDYFLQALRNPDTPDYAKEFGGILKHTFTSHIPGNAGAPKFELPLAQQMQFLEMLHPGYHAQAAKAQNVMTENLLTPGGGRFSKKPDWWDDLHGREGSHTDPYMIQAPYEMQKYLMEDALKYLEDSGVSQSSNLVSDSARRTIEQAKKMLAKEGSFEGFRRQPRIFGSNFAQGGGVGEGVLPSPVMASHGALGMVQGAGGGQDDQVSAKLSPGEYVMDADVVSALGDGSNEEGARKLDELRERIRAHKRSAPAESIPPKAKPLTAYLKET